MCDKCIGAAAAMLRFMVMTAEERADKDSKPATARAFVTLGETVDAVHHADDALGATARVLALHSTYTTPDLGRLAKAAHYMGQVLDTIGDIALLTLQERMKAGDEDAIAFAKSSTAEIEVHVIDLNAMQAAMMAGATAKPKTDPVWN